MALILAAGESRRLGKPKQNLKYGNTTLLNNIKEHLTLYFVEKTYTVLGAYSKDIIDISKLKSSEVIEFKRWKDGMGSSLSYACTKIFEEKSYDGILITLSDLPLVSGLDYQKMYNLFESSSDIVASKSNNSLGVPAIFGSDYFEELIDLHGERGAKPIIKKYSKKVKVFVNENVSVDIDTLEDYSNLTSS